MILKVIKESEILIIKIYAVLDQKVNVWTKNILDLRSDESYKGIEKIFSGGYITIVDEIEVIPMKEQGLLIIKSIAPHSSEAINHIAICKGEIIYL